MQRHPKAPRLWSHANAIIRKIELKPARHEPCIYAVMYNGQRVLLKRQVDNFEVAAPDARTAALMFDEIDKYLTFPLKRMELVTLFNGFGVLQT